MIEKEEKLNERNKEFPESSSRDATTILSSFVANACAGEKNTAELREQRRRMEAFIERTDQLVVDR